MLMTSNPPTPRDSSVQPNPRTELIRTHAEMLAADAEARAAKRRMDLEELRSDLKTPEERIRVWERVHGLSLPRDPNHRIIGAIARETRLTLEQVRAVQLNDAARRMAQTVSGANTHPR
jgi:hypothetical protein